MNQNCLNKMINPEKARILGQNDNKDWKFFGPYLTDRQWGTVREDYSQDGSAWEFIPHELARSNAYRWGEEGIGGISDHKQQICFAWSFWNGNDSILKERFYGLTGNEGNHGEDVKELYYYLDSTPTHSYMKMLYKYPINEFPYAEIANENKKRTRLDPEYELIDTGIFDNNEYFDIFMEYAKVDQRDILIKATVHNRSDKEAEITILPTSWFRNDWAYKTGHEPSTMYKRQDGSVKMECKVYGDFFLYAEDPDTILFCDNETNTQRIYGFKSENEYFKDGINDYIIDGKTERVNPLNKGSKCSFVFKLKIPAKSSKEVKVRLAYNKTNTPFYNFDTIFYNRIKEADQFYDELQSIIKDSELKDIQRQGFAGMMWSKQFYYYNVFKWYYGDEEQPKKLRANTDRNHNWLHLTNKNILSMPDAWEYPWYAAWDLAFHTIPIAYIDPYFAKRQLLLLLREYYMHPNGQIPAYEWNFSDVNPPVHAWAVWEVFLIDKKMTGNPDYDFLEKCFQKLVVNFTWWVNQKDTSGNNIFEGGFLGLDNIGVFDRSHLPKGIESMEQADATSWMAMYSLNLLRMSLELAKLNPAYQESASKFFSHFLFIAGSITKTGKHTVGLWNEEDQFYYDTIILNDGTKENLKIRSMVGLIPLFAVETFTEHTYSKLPDFKRRLRQFLEYRPDLAKLIIHPHHLGQGDTHILSLVDEEKLRAILTAMLDEKEFLSEYGLRSLSKFHEEKPFVYNFNGGDHTVKYLPGESDSGMFGGNSNWRGPIWFPLNFMVVESLFKYYEFYGDDFTIEYPTGSGNLITLHDVATELSFRLVALFRKDKKGNRPCNGGYNKLNKDVHFKDHLQFHEFFHGDNGKGLGASHQTGWTGLVCDLIFNLNGLSQIKKE